jgi:uncharacterized membrane protein YkvA (DUF1232 family)
VQWWTWLLVSLGVVLVMYASFIVWLVIRGRREDARALATFIPDCIVIVTRLARDPRVPRRRKLLLIVLVAYLALPFDLVPDFIPVAGQLDDAIIVALVLRHFVRAGGEPMIRELWPGPEQSLALILRLARPGGSQPHPDAIGGHSRRLAQASHLAPLASHSSGELPKRPAPHHRRQ